MTEYTDLKAANERIAELENAVGLGTTGLLKQRAALRERLAGVGLSSNQVVDVGLGANTGEEALDDEL